MPKPKEIWIDGINRIAAAIAAEFKTTCSRQDIRHWKGENPPFPTPRTNNHYPWHECREWYEKNKLAQRKTDGDLFTRAARAKAEEEIRDNEESKFDFDVKKNLYITRDEAYQKIVAALMRFKYFVRDEIEKRAVADRREKLRALDVKEEAASQFFVWDTAREIALIDAIENRCEEETKGADAIIV